MAVEFAFQMTCSCIKLNICNCKYYGNVMERAMLQCMNYVLPSVMNQLPILLCIHDAIHVTGVTCVTRMIGSYCSCKSTVQTEMIARAIAGSSEKHLSRQACSSNCSSNVPVWNGSKTNAFFHSLFYGLF